MRELRATGRADPGTRGPVSVQRAFWGFAGHRRARSARRVHTQPDGSSQDRSGGPSPTGPGAPGEMGSAPKSFKLPGSNEYYPPVHRDDTDEAGHT